MKSILLFWIVVWASCPAISQAVSSNVYAYNRAPVVNYMGCEERTLLEGTTRDFSHVVVQAITVPANRPSQPAQQLDEEALVVIKTGELTLAIGGKRKSLGPGDVVMIMPGDDYRLENKAAQPLTYYLIRYTSNEMPDLDLYQLMGGSFWIDWQEIAATADRQRTVTQATVMSHRVVLKTNILRPGMGNHAPHTHRAAEIIFVLDHPVQARIDGVLKEAQAGDLIFVESDVSHEIDASRPEGSTCLFFQF
jgi:(S)-ureidoglycine aminohydrolase